MRLIFLGAPGSGKGTQAELAAGKLTVPHISTGDMLRDAIAEKTPLGNRINKYLESGELVPDEIIIRVMEERLEEDNCRRGYILDGFPRTLAQAGALDKYVHRTGKNIHKVILIELSEEEIIKRLASRVVCSACDHIYSIAGNRDVSSERCGRCGGVLTRRSDDRESTVRERIRVFKLQTEPLRNFYAAQQILEIIDGNFSIEVVHRSILKALDRAELSL